MFAFFKPWRGPSMPTFVAIRTFARVAGPRAFSHAPITASELAAFVPRSPGGIDVSGVDQRNAGFDAAIKQVKRRRFVRGPAEHVAAKSERHGFER